MGILNPKRKEKKPPQEVPKWFKVMMLGFVFYAIVNSLLTDKVGQIQRANQKNQSGESTDFLFSPLLSIKEGGRNLPLLTRDRTVGEGPVIGCWEMAEINYRLYNRKNELIEKRMDKNDPLRFNIGKGEVTLALDRGTLGMQKNGRREITARPEMAFGAPGFTHPKLTDQDFVAYDVMLLNIVPPENLPASNFGLRIYEDKTGKGNFAQCTDRITLNIRGWKMDGSRLWPESEANSAPVMVVVGKGQAPYAVEKALLGMQIGGKRTVIVPPGYEKPLFPIPSTSDMKKNSDFNWETLPLPENEVILLEIEMVGFADQATTSSKE